MNTPYRVAAVVALGAAVAVVVAAKARHGSVESPQVTSNVPVATAAADAVGQPEPPAPPATRLPRLVDLGAGKCTTCKMMTAVLDELIKEHPGVFDIEFIDVAKDPRAGEAYGIRIIPTQIFFGADGRELFRHEGFMGKEDILAKWRELGVTTADGDAT